MNSAKMMHGITGLIISSTVLISGCNPPSNAGAGDGTTATSPGAAPAPAAPTLPNQPPFRIEALAPSQVLAEGPPAQFSLSTGYVLLVYSSTAVVPGDEVSFEFTASGADKASLRTVLMRHCGDGPEMDSASEVFQLSSAPHPYVVQHKFASKHPCLRVMFTSPTGAPIKVALDSWKLTAPDHATAPPAQPSTPAQGNPTPVTPAPAKPN